MRTTYLILASMLTTGCFYPAHSTSAEVGVVVPAPTAEIAVYAYSSPFFGEWRTAYLGWTPVTIYYVSGHYYRSPVRNARAVVVYRRGGDYFFPPRDRAWNGFDKRFNYAHAPTWRDHGRAKHKDNGRRRGHS